MEIAVNPAGMYTKMYPCDDKIANIHTLGTGWKDFFGLSGWLCIRFIFLRDKEVGVSGYEL